MISRRRSLGRFRPHLLAALILCLLPGLARAETLYFRNECKTPVVVQAVSVVGGVLRRDKPYLLNAGDRTPGIMLPGNKVITVYDSKVPNRILFQGVIPAGRVDLYYGIVPGAAAPKVRMMPRRPGFMQR
jgi:hypothetical protein